MAARKELLLAAGHYAAQSGLDERLASAENLQALALALSPQALKADIAGAQDAVVRPSTPRSPERPGPITAAATAGSRHRRRRRRCRAAAACCRLSLWARASPPTCALNVWSSD